MIGNIVDRLGRRFGYEIRRVPESPVEGLAASTDPLDREIAAAMRVVEGSTMLSEGRLETLYRQVMHCEKAGVPGALVECGAWKGGGAGMMAIASLRHGTRPRDLYLFDAFVDICEPDAAVDGRRAVREVMESGCASAGASGAVRPMDGFYDRLGGPGRVDEVRRLLVETVGYPPTLVHIHEGWFQDTVPSAAAGMSDVAVLHLDGDWYESVRICLEHLHPRVVSGGFVSVDDYHYYDGCTLAVDEYREAHGIGAFIHHADYTDRAHGYWINP